MIGVYDFCGHYEWTFAWLDEQGGPELVEDYWVEAISIDAQRHARELIIPYGFEGMKQYWTPTLEEEGGDCVIKEGPGALRIEMHSCPSKGFLQLNGLQQYPDYCDHCMGWIGPLMRDAGFSIDHQHNHRGQCWWEFRQIDDPSGISNPGAISGPQDIRFSDSWPGATTLHGCSQTGEGPVGAASLETIPIESHE